MYIVFMILFCLFSICLKFSIIKVCVKNKLETNIKVSRGFDF